MIQLDTWTGCYDQNWKNLITPAAFSHPAKFSHGLIKRIYDHALQDGLIQPGQIVLDPFGGVGLGALYAMQNGLHWVGVELEPKFVELARENIALWNARYAAHFPNWGTAEILAGDSRNLAQVVSAGGLVVSSPPYATDQLGGGGNKHDKVIDAMKAGYGKTNGQIGQMKEGTPPCSPAIISSPPFAGNTGGRGEASRNGIDPGLFDRHSGGMKKGTGDDPANLDHLPQGQPPMAIVSSPPYAESIHQGQGGTGVTSKNDKRNKEWNGWENEHAADLDGYGSAPGQLGAMKAGAAVIGSPPFENSINSGKLSEATIADLQSNGHRPGPAGFSADYGSTDGQIGATQGQTFWEAARLIVEQCALLLPVGGAAIWVVKGYIKNGKYVDFPGQWQQLCEACGFETVHVHRAMLVKRNGSQAGFDGEMVSKDVARKSFFRRLHERRRPDLAIDWETVLCMRKAA